ncbi:acyl-CoA desaturase [bacterium]|nr:acyl-CoA desaturase [bacterium]
MGIPTVKFNRADRPEFIQVLRKKVDQYFRDEKISKHANTNMVIKTVFMILLYFTPLVLLISGVITSFWMMMLMWVLMAGGMSGIGLSIMHDANHGSYSRNQKVNKALGFLVNFLGGYHVNWKIQHNVLHHSFTNIHEFDEDIARPVMRFSPDQDHKPIYKFQILYAPFLYGLLTLFWFTGKDFELVSRYNKEGLLKTQGLTFRKALTQVIIHKLWYVALFLVLPMIFVPLPWWQVLIGFLTMHFLCGLTLALIFQPAHVTEDTHFFKPDETGSVENNWAIHQLLTTSNFANKSVVFSWLIGGLNYQIEHHLFPNICHVHYRNISKIVKSTAQEYNIPYYQKRTFAGAVLGHFKLLHNLGMNRI